MRRRRKIRQNALHEHFVCELGVLPLQRSVVCLLRKTVSSLRRNVITPLLPLLSSFGFNCDFKISRNCIEIEKGGTVNRFYLFGGRDESSASLIQGMTLGGVLLDEVALMPRSFVEQALARCSLENSKFWFNCNPEHPFHWFYNEWIKKKDQKTCFIFILPCRIILRFHRRL